jgi:UDP-glucose 4-epimerase
MITVITGHRGFIGGKLHTKLIEDQKDFMAFDSLDPGPYPYTMPDLTNVDVDTIYHIGAVAGIETCEAKKEMALRLNVMSTQQWAEIALEKNARLVFTSSAAAASITPTWYGLTKKMAENMLLHYKRVHKLKVTIFRLPNIYGPGSLYKKSVIANMCKDAILNKAVYIHGDGKQTRNFMHVDDVIRLLQKFNKTGIFRIYNAHLHTIKHLAEEIADQFSVVKYNTPARQDSLIGVDASSAMPKDINYDLRRGFHEGLLETIEYFKKEVKAKEDT